MNSEEKQLKSIMTDTLKEVVLPRLEKIEGKLGTLEESNQAIMEMVAKNSEDATEIKEGMAEVKEEMTDMKYVDERIETKLDTSIRRESDLSVKTSQLSRRVLRLESKKA